jgi:carnitine 3-dehydrogenase
MTNTTPEATDMRGVKTAAAIGGGVIGGGWIARFLLNGINVNVFDPHPQVQRLIGEIIANAERAYSRLFLAPMPPRGTLVFTDTLAEAVRDAGYIQESVPERLELKHKVYTEIEKHCRKDALIGSSASGFTPTQLQENAKHPERIFVAHPFNPVYLLPLVELVPSAKTSANVVAQATAFLSAVGMKPLLVRKEIDAHIADRLLEAVWREGLWLVKDGIATTEELDDAIRFGFGLRWAQMGLFETYRIAGGEAGMRHFISQFGPALAWPWTKLMDVPELTDELITMIADQSDAQSGRYSIRELERIRDDNLVGIMQAQKTRNWGVGELLINYEKALYDRNASIHGAVSVDISQPLALHHARVREDWVDYNGHMTESRYLQVFGDASDAFLNFIGMDAAYLAAGSSVYTVETHIRHLREVGMGEKLRVTTQLLGFDQKRLRIVHLLYSGEDDILLASAEHMALHVDTEKSCASTFGTVLNESLAAIWAEHRKLDKPDFAGKGIGGITM